MTNGQECASATSGAHDGRRRLTLNVIAGGSSSAVKVAVQIVLLPLMARLLGPSEFGVYAIALPLVTFFTVIADGGLGLSLAREASTKSTVWSTAFWVMLVTGAVLILLTNGCGLLFAHISGDNRVLALMSVLSLSFFFIAISVLPLARLTRRNDLVTCAAADLLATLVGAAIAVGFAVAGFGAMSLAFQYVGVHAIRAAILNAKAFEMPKLEFQIGTLRPHVGTGSVLISGRLFDLFCRLVENVLFGRIFGAAALGTYTFANQVPRFLCEAASNPTWGALYAQSLQDERSATGELVANLCRLMALATFPVSCLLAASAHQVFALLLGSKWTQAGTMMQILMPAYSISAIASLGSAVMLAEGRNATFLLTFAGLSLGRVIAVTMGTWTSPLTVVWLIVLVNLSYASAMLFVTPGEGRHTRANLAARLVGPLVAAVVGGSVCYGVLSTAPAGLWMTLVGLAIGSGASLACLVAIEGARIRDDLEAIRGFVFSKRPPSVRTAVGEALPTT